MANKKKKALTVLTAGIFFNLSIGVLYSWSIIKTSLTASLEDGGWGWTSSQAGLPYTVAILLFAVGLLIGGRIQDKIGPRIVVTIGGLLVGLGLIISGLINNSVTGLTLSFGVITGLGIGFGYGCISPPALKWFHSSKKGLISGLVVGGFGIAAVYLAPLTNYLLTSAGIQKTFLILGIAVCIISIPLAQFIVNPPEDYIPEIPKNFKELNQNKTDSKNFTWQEMLKTPLFYLLFIMFTLSSSVGLMVIGNISKIAKIQCNITDVALGALIVSFLAVTNTFGRIFGGFLSDKIGRINTLILVFVLQAVNMIGFAFYNTLSFLNIGIILVGFCYGTLLSVFPSLVADQYGLKNYGINYGILYLAWGLSGVLAPMIADFIYDKNGNFYNAYYISAFMLVGITVLAVLGKRIATQNKSVNTEIPVSESSV